MKKRILLVLVIALLVLALLWVMVVVLQMIADRQADQEKHTGGTPQTIIFYTPDYSEDITKDSGYMQLNRQVYYADLNTGVTISLDDETFSEYGEATALLYRMIAAIIAGDHETYNTFFSRRYLDAFGEKDMFTAQKLYMITISKASEEQVSEDNVSYDKYTYILEYMIYKNNGTFRTDVGSDAIRKQEVILTDREGSLLIDELTSYSYAY